MGLSLSEGSRCCCLGPKVEARVEVIRICNVVESNESTMLATVTWSFKLS